LNTRVPEKPTVRAVLPSEWEVYKSLRLRALADSPDAFSSTLAAELERPDEQWAERVAEASATGQDLPLFALVRDVPVGMAWARVTASDESTVNLFQMWVDPKHRGLGLGGSLLDAAISWAHSLRARELRLCVTRGETPAVRMYLHAGFQPVGKPEPLREGSLLLAQHMTLSLR